MASAKKVLTAKEFAIANVANSKESLVQLKVPNVVEWVPSNFNARATTPDGVLVLYNSLSGAVSGFPRRHASLVCNLLKRDGFVASTLSELEEYLVQRGYLVPKNVDELQRFRHQYARDQHRPDVLELIVLASEECNFRCTYCYESFPRGTMEPWVREATIKLVQARSKRLNRLNISYFGGEPLLGLEAIDEIALAAKRITDEQQIPFSSSITTNGYLLAPDVFERLVLYGIRAYQVTIDGIEECHNHNRPLKGGGSTFKTILRNLRAMKESRHDFSVTLRVNFDRQNVPTMPELLEEIKDFRGDNRFKIRFFPIGKWGGPNDADLDVCGHDAETEKRKLDVLASEIGFASESRLGFVSPTSKSTVCYAARPYNLIIGADGKLMKCTVVLDSKDYNIVGNLTLDGRAEIDIDRLLAWTAPYFENDETCKKCFYLPICQGASCPLPRLESGDRPCPSPKLEIGRTLTGIWQQHSSQGTRLNIRQEGVDETESRS